MNQMLKLPQMRIPKASQIVRLLLYPSYENIEIYRAEPLIKQITQPLNMKMPKNETQK